MGPEKPKQEKPNEEKPAAQPHREEQTGMSQANQSLWDSGKEGKALEPPPDAIPKQDPKRKR